jgi:PAS domain S-box-containing protein
MDRSTSASPFDAVARLAWRESGDAFLAFDGAARVVEVNPAAERLAGRPAADLRGLPLAQLFPPAFGGAALPAGAAGAADWRGVLARGDGALAVDVRVLPPPGDGGFGLLAVRPAPPHVAALTEREAFLRALGDNLPDGTVYQCVRGSDRRFRFTYVSAGVEQTTGLSAEEALRDPGRLWRMFPPEELRRLRRAAAASARYRTPLDVELRRRAPSGEARWFHLRAAPRRAADGSVVWDGVELDVTERRRAEEERREFERGLLEAQKLESIGVLAGGVAHDFNNLLTGVLGYAGLAEADLPPASPARAHLGQVERSARRAAELCQQLLAYADKGQLVVRPLDLSAAVWAASALLESSVSKKAALALRLPDDLPPVEADGAQLRQAVLNLVLNAAEALGDGPGAITVSTGLARADRARLRAARGGEELPAGAYVCLEVADTGCGMDAPTKARVFEPFFTTKFTGRGLGLSAVLGIVRGHGGAVEVESEPGRGSRFRLLFPPCPASAPAAGAAVAGR